MKPKVSIIVPMFNSEKTIEGCVASLLKQSYEHYGIILIDDCSTDNTYELVKNTLGYADERLIKIERNRTNVGAAASRNFGIREAEGEYIAFTDSDCIVASSWLSELVACLIANNGEVAGGAVKTPEDANYFVRCVGTLHKPAPSLISEAEAEDVPTCNAIFKKSLLTRIGGFDEAFKLAGGEDTELCARIRTQNIKIHYTSEAIIWHYHKCGLLPFIKWRFHSGIGLSKFAKKHFFKSKFLYNMFNLLLFPCSVLILLSGLLFAPLVLVIVLPVAYLVNLAGSYLRNREEFKFSEVCFGVILGWLLRIVTSIGFCYGLIRYRRG